MRAIPIFVQGTAFDLSLSIATVPGLLPLLCVMLLAKAGADHMTRY